MFTCTERPVPILAKTLKGVALNRSLTSPPRNSGAISNPRRSTRQHPGPAPWNPQPWPQHHQPQCPPQPAQTTPAQFLTHPDEAYHPPPSHRRPTPEGATARQAELCTGSQMVVKSLH
ncbi:unnamed protein product [Coregonus sp. 'balchen']|nr:unnamed protein product [Coregonus sp. 'balchen']